MDGAKREADEARTGQTSGGLGGRGHRLGFSGGRADEGVGQGV